MAGARDLLHAWLKWVLFGLSVNALCAAIVAFAANPNDLKRTLLAGAVAMTLIFTAPVLPLYTPLRGRVYRVMKWAAMLALLVVAFGPLGLKWAWLPACSMWMIFHIEWTRASIRRKLPAGEWPRHLYL